VGLFDFVEYLYTMKELSRIDLHIRLVQAIDNIINKAYKIQSLSDNMMNDLSSIRNDIQRNYPNLPDCANYKLHIITIGSTLCPNKLSELCSVKHTIYNTILEITMLNVELATADGIIAYLETLYDALSTIRADHYKLEEKNILSDSDISVFIAIIMFAILALLTLVFGIKETSDHCG
jgi:hypothetical protein